MSQSMREIRLRDLYPNKLNPRLDINIQRLNELAASIKQLGLLEPIVVRPAKDGYEVVVGERRYRASQQAGLQRIPAIVREYTDEEVVQLNLVENVQREDLSAIEKGKVCRYLQEHYPGRYASQTALAKRIGVSSDTISLWLRAVDVVPEEVQKYVAPSAISGGTPEGKIDYLTAVKVGRKIKESERRVELIKKLAEKRLPVKERQRVIEAAALEPEKPLKEVIDEMPKTTIELTFRAEDKRLLLDGRKTQSARTATLDSKLKAGTIVNAVIWEPHVADLRITSVERKRLKYFDEEDARGEGGYTLKEFKKQWRETHGDWNEEEFVHVVHFEKA